MRKSLIQCACVPDTGLVVDGVGPTFTQMANGWRFSALLIGGPALVGLLLALPAAVEAQKRDDMAAGAFGWIGVLASGGWLLSVAMALVLF